MGSRGIAALRGRMAQIRMAPRLFGFVVLFLLSQSVEQADGDAEVVTLDPEEVDFSLSTSLLSELESVDLEDTNATEAKAKDGSPTVSAAIAAKMKAIQSKERGVKKTTKREEESTNELSTKNKVITEEEAAKMRRRQKMAKYKMELPLMRQAGKRNVPTLRAE